MFDLTWIRDDLAVGGALPSTGDLSPLVDAHGIRHVIDVRGEQPGSRERLAGFGLNFLSLPTADFGAVTPARIDEGVALIERALADGDRVLVHCQLGIGRSVLIILCYLVKQGLSAPDAMLLVKDRRAQASPSPQQIEALLDYELRVRGERSAFDDVAQHAYRHLPEWSRAR